MCHAEACHHIIAFQKYSLGAMGVGNGGAWEVKIVLPTVCSASKQPPEKSRLRVDI